jgi:hypothetical protein
VRTASENPPDQDLEVLGIAREALHDLSVLDIGKRVIDVRQLVGGDGGRIDQVVLGEHVRDDRCALRGSRRHPGDEQHRGKREYQSGGHLSSIHCV